MATPRRGVGSGERDLTHVFFLGQKGWILGYILLDFFYLIWDTDEQVSLIFYRNIKGIEHAN